MKVFLIDILQSISSTNQNNMKTKWLSGIKNSTGSDHPNWRGDHRPKPIGDTWTKAVLVAHLRRAGLIK